MRATALAWRVPPRPGRRFVAQASRYGRALALWERGDRQAALGLLESSPLRQASFALALDRPEAARTALGRAKSVPPYLAARLAWREGRLTDAMRLLDGARYGRARRMRRALAGEMAVLRPGRVTRGMRGSLGSGPRGPARVLHIVTNALPSTHAGYTVRTRHIALAQQRAGSGLPRCTRRATISTARLPWQSQSAAGCPSCTRPPASSRKRGSHAATRAPEARRPTPTSSAAK